MVTTVLERLAEQRGGVLGVVPGLLVEPDDSWTPATALLDGPELAERVDETAARWDAPRHVGAALFWKTYSYWLTLPMALGWALDGRVPVMALRDIWYRVSPAGVTLGATEVSWSDAAAIRPALMEAQAPVLTRLSQLARVGERTLWGSTAEAVAHPLTAYVQGDYMRLLDEIGAPLKGLIQPSGDAYFRRTCCLWITLPKVVDACGSCCVLAKG